ncbi:hypothetical protein A6P39_012435 [Streptomyces sp. FXJ1.172]|uniref:hypothetical protein n=1 Tax=Streptomyces sp. FXJ1.172 TaxID=710705 RepID=UPI0007CF8640|nr:hypothetical protein [Streptomyces sp. FXJ1.172]WEO94750.1 hypothetical protein A6P39_012435 [Streptomyces sp. FXJ1.172]
MDSTVLTHRSAERQRPLVILGEDGGSFMETAARLIGSARYGISIALLHGGPKTDAVLSAVAEWDRRGERGQAGVVVRFLCAPDVLDTTAVKDLAQRIGRAEVRISGGDLHEALIVDGSTAVTWSSQSSNSESATLVTDLAAAKALDLLYANIWNTGCPTPEHLHIRERLSTDVMRRVLTYLRDGHTDAVAASDMAVSLRTYRRHVAKLMRNIGAESRFQAGVRSVELGLLPRER